MEKIRRINIALALLVSASLLIGCERRDMFPMNENVHVNLRFIKNVAWVDTSEVMLPELMAISFHESGEGLRLTDYVENIGGNVSVPAGLYDILACSFGTEYCIVEMNSGAEDPYVHTTFVDASLAGYSGGTKADDDEPEMPLVNQPEYFWSGSTSEEIPVRYDGGDTVDVFIVARVITVSGRVVVHGVYGQKNIWSVSAILTNLAESVSLYDGESSTNPAAVRFDMVCDSLDNTLQSVFNSFGRLRDGYQQGKNVLYVIITDYQGNEYDYEFDVTDDVWQGDGSRIDIEVGIQGDSLIVIPDPVSGGGGFYPETEDWEGVVVPIEI